jgi:hypothetical protein
LTTSPDFDPPQPAASPLPDPVGKAPGDTAIEPTDSETSTETLVPQSPVTADEPTIVMARPATQFEQQVTFVPLAVSVGDGFKFGCGFFLALVLAMLIGFVLFAALFLLTSLFGLNLPISR